MSDLKKLGEEFNLNKEGLNLEFIFEDEYDILLTLSQFIAAYDESQARAAKNTNTSIREMGLEVRKGILSYSSDTHPHFIKKIEAIIDILNS